MCGHLSGSYAWSNNAQSRRKWLAAGTDSLATYAVTLASLPINELVLDDGPLSEVRRRGHPGEGVADVVREAGTSLSQASTGLLAGACKVCQWGAGAGRR
jgi:hypothetical protein